MTECSNCKFSEGDPLHCRYYPPTAMDSERSTYPLVKGEWGCALGRFSITKWFAGWWEGGE